jgi:hypothetical protein
VTPSRSYQQAAGTISRPCGHLVIFCASGDQAAQQETLVHALGNKDILRTKDAYTLIAVVNKALKVGRPHAGVRSELLADEPSAVPMRARP